MRAAATCGSSALFHAGSGFLTVGGIISFLLGLVSLLEKYRET